MAEFTGITAARAEEILGMSVVSGTINPSGHLILTRANGSTIDAGDFTGIVSDVLNDQVVDAIATEIPDYIAGTVINKGTLGGGAPVAFTIPEFNVDNMPNAMVKLTIAGPVTFDAASLPSTPKPNTQWVLRLQQDATGGRTFTTTGFKKSLGVLPISSGANDFDLIVFIYDGTNWLAGVMGSDFS